MMRWPSSPIISVVSESDHLLRVGGPLIRTGSEKGDVPPFDAEALEKTESEMWASLSLEWGPIVRRTVALSRPPALLHFERALIL